MWGMLWLFMECANSYGTDENGKYANSCGTEGVDNSVVSGLVCLSKKWHVLLLYWYLPLWVLRLAWKYVTMLLQMLWIIKGKAFEYPHLGAAGVIADEYLPQAQTEGWTSQYFPQAGIIGSNPALVFNKALECLDDKHIYSECDAAHRLTQEGLLNVPPEYTDEYCRGPCFTETHHALECIDRLFSHFLFYNRASTGLVRETLEGGCSYGPKRGNFNVLEHHTESYESGANNAYNPLLLVFVLMVFVWQLLF